MELTLSFASAPPESGLQRWSYLADMEDAQLLLKRLEMRHPLMRADALAALVRDAATHQPSPSIFGPSQDFLGNIFRMATIRV